MELELKHVNFQGDVSEEYLVIKVVEDCNLKNFMVCDRTFNSDGSSSNKHRHIYFFPSYEVKAGEAVWLNTRPGNQHEGRTQGGSVAHAFYWGLNSPVWNETGDRAHLVKISKVSILDIPKVS